MTWTYDATDMSSDLNKVRANLGDTDTNKQLLSDEIINAQLTETPDVYLTIAILARGPLKGALLRHVDRSGTGFSATRSQINQNCNEIAENAEKRARKHAQPSYGGVSESDAESLESNSDFLQPTFKAGHHENA